MKKQALKDILTKYEVELSDTVITDIVAVANKTINDVVTPKDATINDLTAQLQGLQSSLDTITAERDTLTTEVSSKSEILQDTSIAFNLVRAGLNPASDDELNDFVDLVNVKRSKGQELDQALQEVYDFASKIAQPSNSPIGVVQGNTNLSQSDVVAEDVPQLPSTDATVTTVDSNDMTQAIIDSLKNRL